MSVSCEYKYKQLYLWDIIHIVYLKKLIYQEYVSGL